MPQYARIKLTSSNVEQLDTLAREIRDIAEKTGVKCKGPQPLPTKRLKITTRKAPTGEGTHTFDHWQLRIHRRILDIEPNERTMRQITKLRIPEEVKIEMTLTELEHFIILFRSMKLKHVIVDSAIANFRAEFRELGSS